MRSSSDAIIIGGGPAGGTAAILLAQAGWSVTLIERKEFPRRKVCGEYLSATNWPLLRSLGIQGDFEGVAGPEVKRVGLFSRGDDIRAGMPRPVGRTKWGRALGREHLDTLLLRRAESLGVDVRQPCEVAAIRREPGEWTCSSRDLASGATAELRAPVVVAAHGSWRPNPLLPRPDRMAKRPGDLFGFKAHFREAELPEDLMAMLAFPGGYGGIAHCDGGRVSLSFCVRRERLRQVQQSWKEHAAGDAMLRHILGSSVAARGVLEHAVRDGQWLSTGPIQPGIRPRHRGGMFMIGNAAGEAHPVIAEGISMAMQSAGVLADHLAGRLDDRHSPEALEAIGRAYASDWRKAFAPRLRAATVIAHLAMSPTAARVCLPVLRRFPALITGFAHWSGKTTSTARDPAEDYATALDGPRPCQSGGSRRDE